MYKLFDGHKVMEFEGLAQLNHYVNGLVFQELVECNCAKLFEVPSYAVAAMVIQ